MPGPILSEQTRKLEESTLDAAGASALEGGLTRLAGTNQGAQCADLIHTDRLILRDVTEADAELLFDLDSDPEVMRYIGPRPSLDVADYRAGRGPCTCRFKSIHGTVSASCSTE